MSLGGVRPAFVMGVCQVEQENAYIRSILSALGSIGRTAEGITRLAYTAEEDEARQWLKKLMQELGINTKTKAKKAQELGVKILTEDEFLEMTK